MLRAYGKIEIRRAILVEVDQQMSTAERAGLRRIDNLSLGRRSRCGYGYARSRCCERICDEVVVDVWREWSERTFRRRTSRLQQYSPSGAELLKNRDILQRLHYEQTRKNIGRGHGWRVQLLQSSLAPRPCSPWPPVALPLPRPPAFAHNAPELHTRWCKAGGGNLGLMYLTTGDRNHGEVAQGARSPLARSCASGMTVRCYRIIRLPARRIFCWKFTATSIGIRGV